MKRLIFILLTCCIAVSAAFAKGAPEIKFDVLEHDFGAIREADGAVSCTFRYTNTGTAPLVLTTVSTSCNCTETKFSPRPLAPGKSGKITVTYKPENAAGEFMRTIKVRTNIKADNGLKKKVILKISGTVIPNRPKK